MTDDLLRLPPITLETTAGTVKTDRLARPTVIFFYPKDLSPGCTAEAKEFSALKDRFDALGFDLLGVSPDSMESHEKFIKTHNLTVPLASDGDKTFMTACGAYGPKVLYGKQVIGVKRSTLVADPSGNILWRWKAAPAKGHAQKVLDKISKV